MLLVKKGMGFFCLPWVLLRLIACLLGVSVVLEIFGAISTAEALSSTETPEIITNLFSVASAGLSVSVVFLGTMPPEPRGFSTLFPSN